MAVKKSKKPIMNVLSVDWDYFVDATRSQRGWIFPDGRDNLNPWLQNFLWAGKYAYEGSRVESVGIDKQAVECMENVLTKNTKKSTPVAIAESHESLYYFLKDINAIKYRIYNVDFHHDIYPVKGCVNCGNWFRFLIDEHRVEKSVWIKRADSEGEKSDDGEDTMARTLDMETEDLSILADVKFDVIFICKSSPWSPPHLDGYFYRMALSCVLRSDHVATYGAEDVLESRYDDNFLELVGQQRDVEMEFKAEMLKQ
jgi:hypothetical protein